MNLTSETILRGVVKTLREQIAPSLSDSFAVEAARLAAVALSIVANDVNDAAATRIWENAAIRRLFADAAGFALDSLSRRLAEASNSVDPGYKISELDAENGRLRKLLVELHACVEGRTDAEAGTLDRRIWKFLGEVHERRAPRN